MRYALGVYESQKLDTERRPMKAKKSVRKNSVRDGIAPRLTVCNVRSCAFMPAPPIFLAALQHCFLTACIALFDLGRLPLLAVRPRAALAA